MSKPGTYTKGIPAVKLIKEFGIDHVLRMSYEKLIQSKGEGLLY